MRRKDTDMDTLLSAPIGLLSGLEAQGAISELLDELYADGLGRGSETGPLLVLRDTGMLAQI